LYIFQLCSHKSKFFVRNPIEHIFEPRSIFQIGHRRSDIGLPSSELIPVDDDETYVRHVWAITLGWTVLVVLAGVVLALIAIM